MSTRIHLPTIGAVLLLALAGCGARSAGPAADHDAPATGAPRSQRTSSTVAQHALSADGRVAVRYAVAARSWTPASYRAQRQRQLRLSTGPLHGALQRAAPTREQLTAYRAENARLDATVVAADRLLQTAMQARYGLTLEERSSAAGQTARQRATYLVELRRRGERWLVSSFSVSP